MSPNTALKQSEPTQTEESPSMSDKKVTLEDQGIFGVKNVFWNLNENELREIALNKQEAKLTQDQALLVLTGKYTGRSPNDKFIVKEKSSEDKIWWGTVNKSISESCFEKIYEKVLNYLKGKDLYVQDCYAGTNPEYKVAIRVINEMAWQNLFARNMFVRISDSNQLQNHQPEYTVIVVPHLKLNPQVDGVNSEAFIIPHFGRKLILIGGTEYAGECKKSIFTLLNYILPQKGVMSMHCSANIGAKGDVAVFFGLSGTGKTTLSADPDRFLIGDDEHGWSDQGVFNFEGGCYAKAIRLSQEAEPEIYATTKMKNTILENVVMDSNGVLDFDDARYTENTRISYPIESIPNIAPQGCGGHPQNIIMLTCDAFGVLPPVSRLSSAQAMYHFLSGYTAKVAGTERGIKEPQAAFSACFGAPFMALHPGVYAKLLGEKISKHKVACWLVNTGWSGGAYGVGQRIAIKVSRNIITAILNGSLSKVETYTDSIFGFDVPQTCPDVESAILNPKNTWKDQAAFDKKYHELADMFCQNFKQFENGVTLEIKNAGPKI